MPRGGNISSPLGKVCTMQITSAPGAPRLPPSTTGYDIAFRDVHFHYRPDAPILRGATFTVPAGSSCALVGSSGSGKSTLLRLLFRFYDPTAGQVKVAGRDVREWELGSVRAPVGAVPQVRAVALVCRCVTSVRVSLPCGA